MSTPAAYAGAILTLLMALLGVAGVFFLLLGDVQGSQEAILGGIVASALIAVISGYVVVSNDWPKLWRRVLIDKQ